MSVTGDVGYVEIQSREFCPQSILASCYIIFFDAVVCLYLYEITEEILGYDCQKNFYFNGGW